MKISVIIPFFNTKHKFLFQLFDIIDKSPRENIEFLFIDDGSDKSTSELVEKFCIDKKLKFFRFENNLGVSNARNKGIELASNEFLMFLDSDDLMNIAFLNNNNWNENADLIMFTDSILKDSIKENVVENPKRMELNAKNLSILYFENNKKLNLRSSCCKILRRSLLERNNIMFDTSLPFYEDAFFMSKYYRHVKEFEAYSNVLYFYRIYNASSSKKHNKQYLVKYQLFFDKYVKEFSYDEHLIKALYNDTFRSVLINKFTKSVKKFHFQFAYKLLKANFLLVSSEYINSSSESSSFDFKLSKLIISKKYFKAFILLLTHRFHSSFSTRIKKIFK